MIIDFESQEGEWFSFFSSRINERGDVVYDDPAEDAGRIRLRSLVPYYEKLQEKQKKKVEFVLNPKTRNMERVTYFEEPTPEQARKERDDAWDYMITGIENIFDAAGKEVECTRENKLRLMALPVFDRFVARCLQVMSESGVKVSEEQAKNV